MTWISQYKSLERKKKRLQERIANLSGMQAKIALTWILHGKDLADALKIAEEWIE